MFYCWYIGKKERRIRKSQSKVFNSHLTWIFLSLSLTTSLYVWMWEREKSTLGVRWKILTIFFEIYVEFYLYMWVFACKIDKVCLKSQFCPYMENTIWQLRYIYIYIQDWPVKLFFCLYVTFNSLLNFPSIYFLLAYIS